MNWFLSIRSACKASRPKRRLRSVTMKALAPAGSEWSSNYVHDAGKSEWINRGAFLSVGSIGRVAGDGLHVTGSAAGFDLGLNGRVGNVKVVFEHLGDGL